MTTIDATLRAAVGGAGDDLTLTLDPAFQGLPDAAHGGSVLGLFDLLAARRDRRTVRGRYLRRVPLGVPLALTLARDLDGLACRVAEPGGGTVLVDGAIGVAHLASDAVPDMPAAAAPAPLPVSLTCFACGLENPRGLRAQLAFDGGAVTGAWVPRPGFVGDDGRLSPIALTTLLDEAAFWLGALASGESGMTTELVVTLHGDASAAGAVLLRGDRAATRPRADDPRYWDTHITARDEAGRALATAAITFVAVRGAARRLVTGLLAINPADVVRRVFPAYCA
jgi:hypothetical protein